MLSVLFLQALVVVIVLISTSSLISASDDFTLQIGSASSLSVFIGGQSYNLKVTTDDIDLFTELHIHCFSWASGGHLKVKWFKKLIEHFLGWNSLFSENDSCSKHSEHFR